MQHKAVMKVARFIRDPLDKRPVFDHPWKQGHHFNNRKIHLPDFGGISVFLRSFECRAPLRSATLRATALGIFDLFLNGKRVGIKDANGKTVCDELKPGWTDYRFRVFAFEYDVTSFLRSGEPNLFAAELSRGWWSGRISFGVYGFPVPAFCGEIELCYTDGTTELIASDESFRVTQQTPVRSADIWDGEYFDARIPNPIHGIPDGALPAVLYEGETPEITPHVGETIRVSRHLCRTPERAVQYCGKEENGSDFGKIHVLSESEETGCERRILRAGESLIFDMGQEMVGRPHFSIRAPRGTRLELYVAELLNDTGDASRGNDGPEGSPYLKNYRSALARLVYIASGDRTEEFAPTHTFYGFRYFEITANEDIELLSFEAEVLRSDLKETSRFECSNAEVNRLFSNILWGQRGNYLSVPTDCPQRDERLGWTGDTQVFCGAACYNMDTRGFLRKWLGDLRHSQIGADGAYSDIAPKVFIGHGEANAAWGDAGLIVPYRLYLMYGEDGVDIIDEHYASMEDYMRYLTQYGTKGPHRAYGDWLNYDVTDKTYISRVFYANDALLMVQFSEILAQRYAGSNKEAFYRTRAAHYAALRHELCTAFLADYFGDDLELTVKTQTAYLLALRFDLIPKQHRDRAVRRLKRLISENGMTLSTGFVGTGILCQTLQECGASEYAYSLLLQTRDPSWLYSIRQGATTIWERWNSYTKEKGFGDVNMNSFNHYAYGAVAEWMMSGMAGILPDPAQPGFSHFLLFPTPDTRSKQNGRLPDDQEPITFVRASYDSVKGKIESEWKCENGDFVYRVTVPSGTTAEFGILLDAHPDYCGTIVLNGIPHPEEALNAVEEKGRLRFTLSEGSYTVATK